MTDEELLALIEAISREATRRKHGSLRVLMRQAASEVRRRRDRDLRRELLPNGLGYRG